MTATNLEPCETQLEILPEWTDHNRHMNVAFYVLAFDRATDTLYDQLGIGWSYLEREGRSMFTLSMNVDYVGEVFAGDRVQVTSRLVDYDQKRIRYFHEMRHMEEGYLAATNELLAMHVSMATRRSEQFSAEVRARLAQFKAAHAALPLPPQFGRTLALRTSVPMRSSPNTKGCES